MGYDISVHFITRCFLPLTLSVVVYQEKERKVPKNMIVINVSVVLLSLISSQTVGFPYPLLWCIIRILKKPLWSDKSFFHVVSLNVLISKNSVSRALRFKGPNEMFPSLICETETDWRVDAEAYFHLLTVCSYLSC